MRVTSFTGQATAFALCLGLSGLGACHHDPQPEPAPDPCRGQLANPLSFRFLEAFGTPTPDTTFAKQTITFEGPGAPYTGYLWKVGGDPRDFTQRKFALFFTEADAGPLSVRLIAFRPKNTACFPKDDGVDTLTRVLTLVPRNRYRAPVYGKFQGANTDSPKDTFTIRIFQDHDYYYPNLPNMLTNYIRNFSKGCQSPYTDIGLTWRSINFSLSSCNEELGTGYLTTRDSIRIEYSRIEPYLITKSHVFLGRRVR